MRARLFADATALAQHGLVDPGQLAQLSNRNGYKNLAQDLQILSRVLLEMWPLIQGKSATKTKDLQLVNRVATRLMRIVGVRERGPALLAAAGDVRLRAFTRLLRVYEDTRRAIAYLRAHEGAVVLIAALIAAIIALVEAIIAVGAAAVAATAALAVAAVLTLLLGELPSESSEA